MKKTSSRIGAAFASITLAWFPFAFAASDWTSGNDGREFHYALTTSDTGAMFGQWCFWEAKSCLYLVGVEQRCEENSRYTVLANSDVGTSTHELLCRGPLTLGNKKIFRLVFSDFDAIDKVVREGARVGFAVPLADGKFRVLRFGLLTSNVHIDSMRAAATARLEGGGGGKSKKSATDEIL